MKRTLACRAVCVVLLTLLTVGPANATGPTTITFAEHPGGTLIDAEYAPQGVRFGKAADVGAPVLAGAWTAARPRSRS